MKKGMMVVIILIFLLFLSAIFYTLIIPVNSKSPQLSSPENNQKLNLNFWGPYIDATVMNESQWNDFLILYKKMNEEGFSHIGIHIWDPTKNQDVIRSRIQEIKRNGYNISLHTSSGHYFIMNNKEFDPDVHQSNGENLKYFDSPGFNSHYCTGGCESVRADTNCQNEPSRAALDPSYTGTLWKKELDNLDLLINLTNLSNSDMVYFDTEVWGPNPETVEYCYPNVIQNAIGNYTGTKEERYSQYYGYWRQKGLDLKAKVKSKNESITVLFYHEALPEFHDGYMPAGTGDALTGGGYYVNNLTKIQELLAGGNYSGAHFIVSFSWSYNVYGPLNWSSNITQKVGFLLKQAGVAGIMEYPGPVSDKFGFDHYRLHVKAFTDGFVRGIDPDAPLPYCGNIQCDGSETCSTCPGDCGECVTPPRGGGGGRKLPIVNKSIPLNETTINLSGQPCVSLWECGEWNECQSGKQIRTCIDSHQCISQTSNPVESQECINSENQNSTITKIMESKNARFGISILILLLIIFLTIFSFKILKRRTIRKRQILVKLAAYEHQIQHASSKTEEGHYYTKLKTSYEDHRGIFSANERRELEGRILSYFKKLQP